MHQCALCNPKYGNLFSPWITWKIAHLDLNNNHSFTLFNCIINFTKEFSYKHQAAATILVYDKIWSGWWGTSNGFFKG
jgi:hypothetical protein